MSKRDWTDEIRGRYPTKHAREAADKAIDRLSDAETMARHVAVWVDAYHAAGGLVGR